LGQGKKGCPVDLQKDDEQGKVPSIRGRLEKRGIRGGSSVKLEDPFQTGLSENCVSTGKLTLVGRCVAGEDAVGPGDRRYVGCRPMEGILRRGVS